ncbi:hypothetical protein QUB60_20900 [Microcoleus sp. A2-C5]|uniref:hypothetical protein n=1 Tax=Microcoleaceae TaxID=1892252 RepID=UPI0022370A75|nr:hypothetical protein [Lyngbya sp. CCAP 1446/10]MCW6050767.1 hypothetical protein [Lyngbya sp. CCAP 1446/10]
MLGELIILSNRVSASITVEITIAGRSHLQSIALTVTTYNRVDRTSTQPSLSCRIPIYHISPQKATTEVMIIY